MPLLPDINGKGGFLVCVSGIIADMLTITGKSR